MNHAPVFDPEHCLWYRQAASCFEEALPIGNGRIGAMVFGNAAQERIALNEDTLWSGYPKHSNRRSAAKYYPIVRGFALQGEYHKAQELIEQHMQGEDTQFYLPLGDLLLDFNTTEKPNSCIRSLSLRDAVCTTEFSIGNMQYRRDAFVSAPDQAVYLRITASQPGALSFKARLTSKLRHTNSAEAARLHMNGICPSGMADRKYPAVYPRRDDRKGMRFAVVCDVQTDGKIRTFKNGTLTVSGASTALLRLCTRTSFNGFDKHPYTEGLDERASCRRDLEKAELDFDIALYRHMEDHQRLYKRCALHLEGKSSLLPTDERLQTHAAGQTDDALYALLFHYGRYLMIAASRQGTQPMNLQGIWNEHLCAPWRGNYTLNINTEMNYWPAEICNLSECHKPLFTLIQELTQTGEQTAKGVYGVRGAAAHHNTDLWRLSGPVSRGIKGSAEWAFWPMALGWLANHMAEHYAYTHDRDFLQTEALPVLQACTRFYLDTLTDDGSGKLTFAPSTSPENTFFYHGQKTAVARSAQMSISIIRSVLAQYLKAVETLDLSESMAAEARAALSRLPDYQTGTHGELLEWDAPYGETDTHHRHVSHLFALFPDNAISLERTPDLAAACKQTLLRRGDEGTGWSLAWKVNLWARLQNSDKTLSLLHRQLRPVKSGQSGGGSYPNLFDAHPPFQIDGNFGACAGIAHMLLQSEEGSVHLLPALPIAWTGHINGLRLHGGGTANIKFHHGTLVSADICLPDSSPKPRILCQNQPADKRVTLHTKKP